MNKYQQQLDLILPQEREAWAKVEKARNEKRAAEEIWLPLYTEVCKLRDMAAAYDEMVKDQTASAYNARPDPNAPGSPKEVLP